MPTRPNHRITGLCALLLGLSFASATIGQGNPFTAPGRAPESAGELVKVEASSMEGAIVPGETLHLAVRFDIAPQWHIYWKNAGAIGAPTQITVNAPDGFEVGETLFPAPHRFTDDTLGDSFGYEHQTVLFVPVTASKEIGAESATFEILVDYLVCKQQCLMGRANLNLVAPVQDDPDEAKVDPTLERHWNLIPESLDDTNGASISLKDGQLQIAVPGGIADIESIQFFPDNTPGVRYSQERSIQIQGGIANLSIPLEIKPGNAIGKPLRVAGVITVGSGNDAKAYEFSRPIIGDNHDRHGPTEDGQSR